MAMDHLRALMEMRAPGRSQVSLETAAGVPAGRLGQYLKDSKPVTRMPAVPRLMEIAEIIGGGCTLNEVFQALLRDLYPEIFNVIPLDLTDDQRRMLVALDRVAEQDRQRAIRMIEVLGE